MTTRTYIPVCPEHHVGGPVGYVLEDAANGECPIIARREPTFAKRCPHLAEHEPEIAEAFARVRAAIEAVERARLETE